MKFGTLLLPHRDEHCIARIPSTLDRMDPKSRLWTVLSIEPKEQAALYDIFADSPADADLFVPSGTDPLKPVIHHGRNTLPVAHFFQKRFCRADDESGELWGYNHQKYAWLTGPGYFVAHAAGDDEKDAPSSYLIDYTRVPPKKAEGWPDVAPAGSGMGSMVYGGMKDYMRKVSEHVSIGRAYKNGKPTDNYFILCREDPE